jgi:hypothetical protein
VSRALPAELAQYALLSGQALEAQGHPILALECLQLTLAMQHCKSTTVPASQQASGARLQPRALHAMFVRLIGACASLAGGAMAADGAEAQQQQAVEGLTSSLAYTQGQLGSELQISPDEVMAVLGQQSLAPSRSRAVLPPLASQCNSIPAGPGRTSSGGW